MVLPGNGDGSFGPEHDYVGHSSGLNAGDFNLDGLLDVTHVGRFPDRILVLLNLSGPSAFTFLADRVTLVWPAVTGALSYDLYRGNMSALLDGDDDGLPDTGYGVCLSALDDDPRDTFFVDTDVPQPAGAGFFYLISVLDSQGDNGLGTTSSGLARVPQVPCP